jgi:pyruvate/2-oxoglutarate dehydrogenase complex dihydrolipoamide acyltransferase (E2) component
MPTEFTPVTNASTFRRIAAAMWKHPSDPTIYGSMDLDVTETLRFIDEQRAATGRRLTITHVVAHAVAHAFAAHPELNAKVRFWGRLEQRRAVDLFVSVAADGARDLSGARIDAAETLTLDALADAIERGARGVRTGADRDYQRSRNLMQRLPWWLVRPVLWLTDVLTNELHVHLPGAGMPRDPFGTAVITNVGTFGIDTAFAPFLPLGRCPMLLLLSEIRPRPVVIDGRVEARPVLRLCGTFDHRVIDGAAAGRLARVIRERVEHPGTFATAAAATATAAAARKAS